MHNFCLLMTVLTELFYIQTLSRSKQIETPRSDIHLMLHLQLKPADTPLIAVNAAFVHERKKKRVLKELTVPVE